VKYKNVNLHKHATQSLLNVMPAKKMKSLVSIYIHQCDSSIQLFVSPKYFDRVTELPTLPEPAGLLFELKDYIVAIFIRSYYYYYFYYYYYYYYLAMIIYTVN